MLSSDSGSWVVWFFAVAMYCFTASGFVMSLFLAISLSFQLRCVSVLSVIPSPLSAIMVLIIVCSVCGGIMFISLTNLPSVRARSLGWIQPTVLRIFSGCWIRTLACGAGDLWFRC